MLVSVHLSTYLSSAKIGLNLILGTHLPDRRLRRGDVPYAAMGKVTAKFLSEILLGKNVSVARCPPAIHKNNCMCSPLALRSVAETLGTLKSLYLLIL